MSEVVGRFSKLRTISETYEEIVVHGHCGVAGDLPEEKFSKPEHRLQDVGDEYVVFRD